MKYEVIIQKRVLKFLVKINEPDYSKIKEAMFGLGDNPRPYGYIKPKNRSGYRIRVGNYRIIYEISDKEVMVEVLNLGLRKDIYE